MKLITKNIVTLIAIINIGVCFGQIDNSTETKYHFPQDDHYLIIKLGWNKVFPIGNTFTGDNLKSGNGLNIEASFNLFEESFLLGVRYAHSSNDVKNRTLVGNYSDTFNSFIGGFVGYQFFSRQKIRITPSVGVGHVTYKNDIGSNSFTDSGTTFWIDGEASYNLTKHFALYVNATLQNDYLKIDVPAELADYFKSGHFIRLGIGVKFIL
jgi:hypothetical protein